MTNTEIIRRWAGLRWGVPWRTVQVRVNASPYAFKGQRVVLRDVEARAGHLSVRVALPSGRTTARAEVAAVARWAWPSVRETLR